MGIFNAIFLVLFIFFYEETKYIPVLTGQESITPEVKKGLTSKHDMKDPI